MSGRYVSRVLESALAPDLKFTAAVFASFADDDGLLYPSIGHVAYLRGLEERRVQYHVKDLRRMEILALVRPATQWHATHYRLRLDKLPARAPFRPPERQRWLLGPPGVHSTAPPSGVHSTAPGVQPSAPDPSVRSVTTHTYDARARGRVDAGVQPTAPLTADPELPLVGAVPRDTAHDAHAWCGRLCVPKFLHREFKRALGGPIAKRARRMRMFYAATLALLPADRPIGAEPVKFWRAAFAARFSQTPPVRSFARHDGAAQGSSCDHDPQCATRHACIDRTLADARRKSG